MRSNRALWASTTARGGIGTFVMTMQESPLWECWHVRLVSTHANGSLSSRLFMFVRAVMSFVAELVFRRPAVVHLHISHYGSFWRKAFLFSLAKLFGVPVVLHIHGSQFHEFVARTPDLIRYLIKETLERSDAVMALGELWADRIRSYAPKSRVIVLPNSVAPEKPVNQEQLDTVSIVFLGEVGERKGTFVLLEAWAKAVSDAAHPCHLTIAGDGDVDKARKLASELRVESSVDIVGWISRAAAGELLRSSHVLVLPSRNEGQPMAILEAMSNGLCVIATDVGGIPEMLANGAGILISPDSVESLAEAMTSVIDDEGLRSTLAGRASERVENHFNVNVLARRLHELYVELGSQEPRRMFRRG